MEIEQMGKGEECLPEGCLRIAADASGGAINATLLGEGSWGSALLTSLGLLLLLLVHLLGLLALHTVSILRNELALLVWVVLERHVGRRSLRTGLLRFY